MHNPFRGEFYVMETFGGESGVSKVIIRRILITGQVFDLVTGFDTKKVDREILLEYVSTHQPLVVVAGPPCTAFSNLSRINHWKYEEIFAKSTTKGIDISQTGGKNHGIQSQENRYFLIENPTGSELFRLPEYQRLWKTNRLGKIKFPQCGAGLATPDGEPIHKSKELWAKAKELLMPFEGIQCCFEKHGSMVGTYKGQRRSKLAQVWPPGMRGRIVEGVCLLLRRIVSSRQKPHFLVYPVEEEIRPRRGRPRKYPEAAFLDCPACKSSRPWSDPRHTRNEEPLLLCKHAGEIPDFPCPGCEKGESPHQHKRGR